MNIQLEHGSATHVGKIRRMNEDDYRVDGRKRLFVVADGMGGHAAGEVASRIATDTICERFRATRIGTLFTGINVAHMRVKEKQKQSVDFEGMGTTLTALHITKKGRMVGAHVGDSRIYGYNGTLKQLTTDHTLLNYYRAQGIKLPQNTIEQFENIITRAIGSKNKTPDVVRGEVKHKDVYLLCSDGLTKHVGDDEIEATLEKVRSGQMHSQQAADKLVQMANDGGGHDNITVIVVKALEKAARVKRAFGRVGKK